MPILDQLVKGAITVAILAILFSLLAAFLPPELPFLSLAETEAIFSSMTGVIQALLDFSAAFFDWSFFKILFDIHIWILGWLLTLGISMWVLRKFEVL